MKKEHTRVVVTREGREYGLGGTEAEHWLSDYDVATFLRAVRIEVFRAISLFPTSRHQTNALTEESGEVVKAMNEYEEQKNGVGAADIYKECVQTAAMALRLALHGDSTYRYRGLMSSVAPKYSDVSDDSESPGR